MNTQTKSKSGTPPTNTINGASLWLQAEDMYDNGKGLLTEKEFKEFDNFLREVRDDKKNFTQMPFGFSVDEEGKLSFDRDLVNERNAKIAEEAEKARQQEEERNRPRVEFAEKIELIRDQAKSLLKDEKISPTRFEKFSNHLDDIVNNKNKATLENLPTGFSIGEDDKLELREKTTVNTAKGFSTTTAALVGAPLLVKLLTGDDKKAGIAAAITAVGIAAYATSSAVSLISSGAGRLAEYIGEKSENENLMKFGSKVRDFSADLWTKTNDAPQNLASKAVDLIGQNKGLIGGIISTGILSKVLGNKEAAVAQAATGGGFGLGGK
jgi:hypothetical protein